MCQGDCADGDATRGLAFAELCDGWDGDCDGVIPSEEIDEDADGVSPCAGDCDDSDPSRAGGQDELCDGIDNDCDDALPVDEVDVDGDGSLICEGDCNDTNTVLNALDVDEDGRSKPASSQ